MKNLVAALLIAMVAVFGTLSYVFHAETWIDEGRQTFCMVLFDNVFEWDISEG